MAEVEVAILKGAGAGIVVRSWLDTMRPRAGWKSVNMDPNGLVKAVLDQLDIRALNLLPLDQLSLDTLPFKTGEGALKLGMGNVALRLLLGSLQCQLIAEKKVSLGQLLEWYWEYVDTLSDPLLYGTWNRHIETTARLLELGTYFLVAVEQDDVYTASQILALTMAWRSCFSSSRNAADINIGSVGDKITGVLDSEQSNIARFIQEADDTVQRLVQKALDAQAGSESTNVQ